MTESKRISSSDKSKIVEQIGQQRLKVIETLRDVKYKIAIMSGKGGVGKSTITANLALTLSSEGYKIGVLDADINGPSISKLLDVKNRGLSESETGLLPAEGKNGIKVVSIDLLLDKDDSPIAWKGPMESSAIWRGSMEMGVVREFLSDILWGELDFLFIDLPPGTSDKALIVSQLIPDLTGAIAVTIPSDLSRSIVQRSVRLAEKLEIPIIGIVENMSSFHCPECGTDTPLFEDDGGMTEDIGLPVLGNVPFHRQILLQERGGSSKDEGAPLKAFSDIVKNLKDYLEYKDHLLEMI